MLGQIVEDRYRIEEELGAGASPVVAHSTARATSALFLLGYAIV